MIVENDKYEVEIINQGSNGRGICKINNFVVFVENALPGEVCDIKIINVKKNYAEAVVQKIKKESQDRVIPKCEFYYECGGCNIMHQNYSSQLEFKKKKVENLMSKIGKQELSISDVNKSEQFNYRNKVTLKVKDGVLGFYKSKTNEIVEIDKCLIASDLINDTIAKIKSSLIKSDNIENLIIKEFDNSSMVSFDSSSMSKDDIERFIDVSDNIVFNDEVIKGNNKVVSTISSIKYVSSHKSFTQVNKFLTESLYKKAINHTPITNDGVALELYSGVGVMSLLLSSKFNKVIGVEINESSFLDAEYNTSLNNISNVKFYKGDANKFRPQEEIDFLVADPPRVGLTKRGIENIGNIKPSNIVYISCNPATLARDVDLLSNYGYKLNEISLFDMFPNTNHVECVVLLVRK